MQFHLQFESETAQHEEHFSAYKIMIHPGEKFSETQPHIILASFHLDEEREFLLIKYLDKFSSSLTPFRITVGDSTFPVAVMALHAQLNIVLKIDVHVPKKYLTKTIVSRIDKNYNSDFSVEKLVLLKRNPENLLEVCKEFYFF